MTEPKYLDDQSLLNRLASLVTEERKTTTAILWHLLEVQKRRLFSDLGFPSLFAYCVGRLGYSESAAQRRIEAMRLLQEMPEIEAKIQDGALSLSVAAQAGTFFKRKGTLALAQKREILNTLEGKSARQAERAFIALSATPLPREKVRALPDDKTEIRLIADARLLEDLEKLKGLLAHKHPKMSWAELIRYMTDVTLKKVDPASKPLSTSEVKTNKRHIPASIRRTVWLRDQGKCQQCGGQRALELDHIKPYSIGGPTSASNLRLLCRNCNQRRAIKTFGFRTMGHYMRRY